MITITLEQIRKNNPCADGWKKVKSANDDNPFPVSSILDSNDLDDTLWVLRFLPDYDELWRKFACWCALANIKLIKPYAEDYDLIVSYLKDPKEENIVKARDAAYAAADAADAAAYAAAAYAAADAAAAYAAAYAAADAAADAAAAALAAAYSANAAAADAAAAYAAYAAADAADAADAAAANSRESTREKQALKLKQILDAGIWVED